MQAIPYLATFQRFILMDNILADWMSFRLVQNKLKNATLM